MTRFWTPIFGAFLMSGVAQADGFAVTDLTTLDVNTAAFVTGEFETLPKPRRLMVACLECSRTAVVTIRLQSAEAGKEADLRDEARVPEVLTEFCPDTIEAGVTCLDAEIVNVGDAVGMVTRTQVGDNRHLRTYELYLDGQKLNVQAIAETRDEADDIGTTAFLDIVPQIILGE